MLEDPLSLTIADHVAGDERRYRTIGAALNGIVLVAHTPVCDSIGKEEV